MEARHEHVQQLLREGTDRLAQGKRREAHRLLRQAAALDPKDVRIWRALLNAVENNEDRRGCLQNIVSLDPTDQEAIQRLLDLGGQLPEGVRTSRPSLVSMLIVVLFWLALIACVVTVLVVLI